MEIGTSIRPHRTSRRKRHPRHRQLGRAAFEGVFFALFVLAFSGLWLTCGKRSEPATSDRTSSTVDSVPSADGVTISYHDQGTGPKALVFVHGWSCDRSYWDLQRVAFAGDYRVVAIDLGGHGQSGTGREVWSIQSFGADVAAVVKKLDLKEVVLIGHSMGGAVIIEAARHIPDRVLALVGADTYQDLGFKFEPDQLEAFLMPFREDFRNAASHFVRELFTADADTDLVRMVAEDMSAAPPEVAVSAMEQLCRYDQVGALEEMRKPIYGINSDIWPTNVDGNRRLAASFELKLMPGVGHFVQLEDSARFNAYLREILSEVWPASPQ